MKSVLNNCSVKNTCHFISRTAFFAAGIILIACSTSMVKAQQPNILVIVLDDARFDMFQPNGGPAFFNTPSINRIANEGINFKYMGATTSVCVASRASMYTGLYAHHHGALDNGTSPKPGLTYVSSILQDAGYTTGFVGKWLLGKKLPDTPVGFDYWAVTDDDEHLDPPIHFNDGTTTTYTGHDAVIYTNLALDFLVNKVPEAAPWALFLFHRVPHLPYEAMSNEDSLYQFASINFPDNFETYHKDFPGYLYPNHEFEGDSAALDQNIRDYFETCHAAEYSVNRILNYLDSSNSLDNTLVIFSSDNGYLLGEHYLEKKTLAYDESLRLPLFIRYPAWFAPGTTIENEFAANIDFAPTLLEAAGIPNNYNMDGVSLHQLATGQVHRKDFFLENYTANGNNWEAVRSKQYAYIYSYCNSVTEEFFDLTEDPHQNNNLINNPAYTSVIQQYRLKRDSLRNASNDTIYPALQNCNLESEFYADADGDGFGNPESFVREQIIPLGYVMNNSDCNDNPTAGGANIHPGVPELANGFDDDCDGLVDELSTYYADADHDGFGNASVSIQAIVAPSGYVADHTDCNDNAAMGGATIHPDAPELMNGIDDNCNGWIDEVLLYQDADQDGYGNPAVIAQASDSLAGYVTDKSDCNDNPAAGGAAVHPNASDICNGIDDNCNGQTDEQAIVATITPVGSVSVCTSTDVVFTANTGSGITYQWLKNSAVISGATKNTYTTAKAGTYQVKESNSFNCISTSPATSMSVLSKPASTITPLDDLNICSTGSVKLQANSGTELTYQWQKGSSLIIGATKKTYTATAKGTYKVIVTKTNGCYKISDGAKVTNSCKESVIGTDLLPEIFTLYPNPAEDAFSLDISLGEMLSCDAIITVKNMMGQEIYSHIFTITDGVLLAEIDPWKNAANGIYLVEVSVSSENYPGKTRQWIKPVIYQH
ncbi:MAG: sulfatase-like hydrolase/transferase [Chitinophagaceae bacterium]|nr:sulfatase-like hydrolase/transferase [Chitinophagaceae bacterium]